jgi:hypothetical protein
MTERKFDNFYGKGASDLAKVWISNPATRSDWAQGRMSIVNTFIFGGYWLESYFGHFNRYFFEADGSVSIIGDANIINEWVSVNKPQGQGGDGYVNQYGNPSATLEQFTNNYKGRTENQIVFGQSSFLGYKFPNDINKKYRFVSIGNGREVDMIHFMVVGRRGYMLGYVNEIKQALSFSSSAFYPQDLYSNKLGINFFDRYGRSIQQNPTKISEYINWYLSNPDNW